MNRTNFIILWKPNHLNHVFCNVDLCDFMDGIFLSVPSCPHNAECEYPVFFDNTKSIPIATINKCNYKDYGCHYDCLKCAVTKIIQNKHKL